MQSNLSPRIHIRTALIYMTLVVPLGILFAEIMAIYFSSALGLISYSLLMQLIFVYSAVRWHKGMERFFLVLSLIPVFRILGFSLPLVGLSTIYWYVIMSVPLLLTCLYVMRTLVLKRWQVGITIGVKRLPHHLLLALSGIAGGIILYQIAPPPAAPLPADFALLGFHMLVWVVFVAGMEEFIFRGIILYGLRQLWRSATLNSIYIALIYTILHINHGTGMFLVAIFCFSLILNLAANTPPHSILGTTLAHGLLNVVYFVILPLASL